MVMEGLLDRKEEVLEVFVDLKDFRKCNDSIVGNVMGPEAIWPPKLQNLFGTISQKEKYKKWRLRYLSSCTPDSDVQSLFKPESVTEFFP